MPPKKPTIDEDVDDLDDVLDEFNAPPPPPPVSHASGTQTSGPSGAAPSSPPHAPGGDEDIDDDFARQLAEGMESLMRELSSPGGSASGTPGAGKTSTEDKAREEALLKAWEAMLAEGMDGASGSGGVAKVSGDRESSAGKGKMGKPSAESKAGRTATKKAGEKTGQGVGSGAGAGDDAFQRTIREAMERMQASEEDMQNAASSSDADSLAALLAALGGDADGAGAGDEENLQGMLEGMMTQLMSKEVLYEPLKELHDKFPEYLETNTSTLSAADMSRYKAQQVCVTKIIAVFDSPGYSDDDPDKSAQIVGLMNEMQSHGSPPSELMGPLPPGFDVGADGLPKLPEGCNIM